MRMGGVRSVFQGKRLASKSNRIILLSSFCDAQFVSETCVHSSLDLTHSSVSTIFVPQVLLSVGK